MWLFTRRPDIQRLAQRRDVDGLARALHHHDPAVRQEAAVTLATCDRAAAVPALLQAIADQEATVRGAVMESLVALADAGVVEALVAYLESHPAGRPPVLAVLGRLAAYAAARQALVATLTDGDAEVRAAAARALGRRGDAQVVGPLLTALVDPEPAVVEAAHGALVTVGAERVLQPVSEVLATGETAAARSAAAHILGTVSDARVLAPLAAALADPEREVRQAALTALAHLPEPGRQLALLADLGTDPVERERGAQRLSQIASLPPLVSALRAVDHPGLRAAAARALGRLGEPAAIPALAAAMADPEPAVRLEATWMLGVTGVPAAREPLTRTLARASDPGLRAAAVRALGRLRDPDAIAALEAAISDPEPAVSAAASRAITTLRTAPAVARTTGPGDVLQAVLFIPDPAPEERTNYITRLLDQVGTDIYAPEADLQVVTMRPGQPVPPMDDVALILRRQFRTPPPGFAWWPTPLADETGRPCLLLRLSPAD